MSTHSTTSVFSINFHTLSSCSLTVFPYTLFIITSSNPYFFFFNSYFLYTPVTFFATLRFSLKTSRSNPLTIMFRPDNFPHHLGRLHAPPPPQRPNQPSSSHHHTSRLVTRHPGGKIRSCFGHGRRFCHFVFSRVRPVNSPCFSVLFCGMLRVIAIACLPEQHHCIFMPLETIPYKHTAENLIHRPYKKHELILGFLSKFNFALFLSVASQCYFTTFNDILNHKQE